MKLSTALISALTTLNDALSNVMNWFVNKIAFILGESSIGKAFSSLFAGNIGQFFTNLFARQATDTVVANVKENETIKKFMSSSLMASVPASIKNGLEEQLTKSLEETFKDIADGKIIDLDRSYDGPVFKMLDPYIKSFTDAIEAPMNNEMKAKVAKHVIFQVMPAFLSQLGTNTVQALKDKLNTLLPTYASQAEKVIKENVDQAQKVVTSTLDHANHVLTEKTKQLVPAFTEQLKTAAISTSNAFVDSIMNVFSKKENRPD